MNEYDRLLGYMVDNDLVNDLKTADRSVIITDFGLDISEEGGWLRHTSKREEGRRIEAEGKAEGVQAIAAQAIAKPKQ